MSQTQTIPDRPFDSPEFFLGVAHRFASIAILMTIAVVGFRITHVDTRLPLIGVFLSADIAFIAAYLGYRRGRALGQSTIHPLALCLFSLLLLAGCILFNYLTQYP